MKQRTQRLGSTILAFPVHAIAAMLNGKKGKREKRVKGKKGKGKREKGKGKREKGKKGKKGKKETCTRMISKTM